jgi:diketogulonate reductase-like aldo/keto reductase
VASKSRNRTADKLLKDLQTSLKELNLDYIDFYQAHFVKDEQVYTQVISSGGALEGLRKTRQRKRV